MDSPTFEAVTAAFSEKEWHGHRVDGQEVIEAQFDAHHTRVPLHVQAFAKINAVSVVSRYGAAIPGKYRHHAGEMLMRANIGLTVGAFELEFDDGSVLFRASNLFPGETADTAIIAGLVHAAIAEMDRITPALTLLARTPIEKLATLDIAELVSRENLIPPPPPSADADTP